MGRECGLPTVRRDLATLADPKLAKVLGGQKAAAKGISTAVAKAIKSIEKLIATAEAT